MSVSPHLPAQMPLAFGNRRATVEQDPDRLAQQVSRAVPLRDLSPQRSSAPFVHRSSHVQAGRVGITAAAHSPLHGVNHAHDKGVFTLPTLGVKCFHVGRHTYRAQAGQAALFLPGEAYSLETGHCSGVMFSLCPREIAAVATTMAGPQSGLRLAPIERPVSLRERDPRQGQLLALMRRSLQLIDLASLNGLKVPRQLGLDDKLQRLMALLLYPQLTAPMPSDSLRLEQRERVCFDALVAMIRQDLLGDWTLTRMERQAGLSRLQLEWCFQASFRCSPLAWLRHQRLCWARERLEDPEPISLSELALACGFADEASFRRLFEDQFQIRAEILAAPS
jgi:AraC-like DNA-binding protein